MYYNLVHTESGQLVSGSVAPITGHPSSMHVVETHGREGTWNVDTLTYDPIPATNIKTSAGFIDLFTAAEQLAIITASTTDMVIFTLLQLVTIRGRVDMLATRTQDALNSFESQGLIGEGRAAEIINS